jgi:hypothetical protein
MSGGSTFPGLLGWLFAFSCFLAKMPIELLNVLSFEDNDLDSNNAFALLLGGRV